MTKRAILVSACLAGKRCRYDGTDCAEPEVLFLVASGEAVAGCPEVLGGLSVPRPAAEIIGGTGGDVLAGKAGVLTREGVDVTAAFVTGAEAFVKIAVAAGCRRAILKSRSPSCGVEAIVDGRFSGKMRPGAGVAAAALAAAGIKIESKG